MNINIKKIAYLCLLCTITSMGSLGYASVLQASNTTELLTFDVLSSLDKPDRLTYNAMTPDNTKDVDKLINNVKVFYNPISEQISLSFKLGKQSAVAIKVMDALGNEVLQLMNGTLDAGNQNLSFDQSGKLNKGFYFVRVVSGSETVVKRFSVRK